MGTWLIDRRLLGVVLASLVLLVVPGMSAQAKNEAMASYRASIMQSLNGHVAAIGAIVDEKVAFRHHLLDHAVAIVGTSRGLLEIFPEKVKKKTAEKSKANGKKSKSSPSFEALATEFNLAAAHLVQVIPSGNKAAIKQHFAKLKTVYGKLQEQTKK